jgi:hypothetical protein
MDSAAHDYYKFNSGNSGCGCFKAIAGLFLLGVVLSIVFFVVFFTQDVIISNWGSPQSLWHGVVGWWHQIERGGE